MEIARPIYFNIIFFENKNSNDESLYFLFKFLKLLKTNTICE